MSILETIILAIVEGLTEFLPISSTGHMILAQGVMGMQSSDYSKAFTVMIQLGAILSVVVLYWRRFFIPGLQQDGRDHSHAPQRWKEFFLFYLKLVVGCIPAGILGLLFEKQIDALLDSVLVVAIMLLLGGILMVFVDRLFSESRSSKISFQNAFFVGLFQCIAMIPGVSRSMATIVGGQQQGLSRKTAAEFSFFPCHPHHAGGNTPKSIQTLQRIWDFHFCGQLAKPTSRQCDRLCCCPPSHSILHRIFDPLWLQILWILPHHCGSSNTSTLGIRC